MDKSKLEDLNDRFFAILGIMDTVLNQETGYSGEHQEKCSELLPLLQKVNDGFSDVIRSLTDQPPAPEAEGEEKPDIGFRIGFVEALVELMAEILTNDINLNTREELFRERRWQLHTLCASAKMHLAKITEVVEGTAEEKG